MGRTRRRRAPGGRRPACLITPDPPARERTPDDARSRTCSTTFRAWFRARVVAGSILRAKGVFVTNVTMTRPDAPQRSFRNLLPPLAILAAAIGLASATLLVTEPERVDQLTVVSRGDFAVNVAVSAGPGEGVLLLGTLEPGSSQTSREILDQGRTWRFSFSSGGESVGNVSVPRSTLARDDWRYLVPPAVFDRISRSAP